MCVYRVRDHKARNNIASAVICMSIAGPRSAALNNAVEAASAAGITIVTAAGEPRGKACCSHDQVQGLMSDRQSAVADVARRSSTDWQACGVLACSMLACSMLACH